MIIRSESFLPRRDFRIHESAHYCVGSLFRLPLQPPEVFRDGSGGRVPFDRPAILASAEQAPDDVSGDQFRLAARNIACMFLAGTAAEAVACGVDTSHLIGARTSDLHQAGEVIINAGFSEQMDAILEESWHQAVRLLRKMWPMVLEVAGDVLITDGTHRPVRLH